MEKNDDNEETYDVLIIGCGISGISAAYHLQTCCPNKSFKILERRPCLGGTWDLFNYPGIRSDSDMYTFGFGFRPYSDSESKVIATKENILRYLHETVDEFGLEPHMEFGVNVTKIDWSSDQSQWTVNTTTTSSSNGTSIPRVYRAQYLFMCSGYYNYEHGYAPKFAGSEDFRGPIVHPQHWPKDLECANKRIVVIGSGATAVTLIPALAQTAEHVTMLQRSPSYIGNETSVIPWIIRVMIRWFGHWPARWFFILRGMFRYSYCRIFPKQAKVLLLNETKQYLDGGYQMEDRDWKPRYNPWEQRFCVCPDGDFFDALKSGKASIVTDHIDHFTSKGILLSESKKTLPADIIITATGLEMQFAGGMEVCLDGEKLDSHSRFVYKGFMLHGVPNLFFGLGYTNASWTLKVDLTNRYSCRLVNYNDRHGYKCCVPKLPSTPIQEAPLLDLSSNYIQRASNFLPKQGSAYPWTLHQNYLMDKIVLGRWVPLKDSAMTFH